MRGKCSVYPDEPRAPKLAVSSDIFNLLNDLNNLTYDGNRKITMIKRMKYSRLLIRKQKLNQRTLRKYLELIYLIFQDLELIRRKIL